MEQGKKQPIDVKSRMFFRVWVFAGTAGFGLVGAWLFYEAIKLESKYSLLYLGIGLFGIIYGLITFLMVFPAFTKKGNIIFRMIEGEDGRLFSGKKSVLFKDIKSLKNGAAPLQPERHFLYGYNDRDVRERHGANSDVQHSS